MVEIVVDYLGKLVIIFLGELDGLLYALVIFVVLDYITGICAAIQAKHLSSNIGAKGIAKKVITGFGDSLIKYLFLLIKLLET